MKYVRYRVLLDTSVRFVAASTGLKDPHANKLLKHNKGVRFIIFGKDCPPQKGHDNFEQLSGKNPGFCEREWLVGVMLKVGHEIKPTCSILRRRWSIRVR